METINYDENDMAIHHNIVNIKKYDLTRKKKYLISCNSMYNFVRYVFITYAMNNLNAQPRLPLNSENHII